MIDFNPRSPHGERRYRDATRTNERRFQSTLPARGATANITIFSGSTTFQSTLPARGATIYTLVALGRVLFQSTLPARGATYSLSGQNRAIPISIHAPRTGSDVFIFTPGDSFKYFNPRSPHGERPCDNCKRITPRTFQSTLPARGATRQDRTLLLLILFQSTLPARGATQRDYHGALDLVFQSTLPARGATSQDWRRFPIC